MKDISLLKNDIEYVFIEVGLLTNEQIQWLNDFGGSGHYSRGGFGVYFECEEDATVFALRWS
jgi:hypothetical protein